MKRANVTLRLFSRMCKNMHNILPEHISIHVREILCNSLSDKLSDDGINTIVYTWNHTNFKPTI